MKRIFDRYITKDGLVYRVANDKLVLCKLNKRKHGYIQVRCNNRPYCIHVLLYLAFKGNIPEGYEIDHIDGNPENNSLDNLACVTHVENLRNPNRIKKLKIRHASNEYKNLMHDKLYGKHRIKGEFGEKFYAKYKLLARENENLYGNEYRFYKKHGHCSWEV